MGGGKDNLTVKANLFDNFRKKTSALSPAFGIRCFFEISAVPGIRCFFKISNAYTCCLPGLISRLLLYNSSRHGQFTEQLIRKSQLLYQLPVPVTANCIQKLSG